MTCTLKLTAVGVVAALRQLHTLFLVSVWLGARLLQVWPQGA